MRIPLSVECQYGSESSGDATSPIVALSRFAGTRTAAYHLRAGLIAAHRRQLDAARTASAQVRVEDLAPAERGWAHFLRGMIAELTGDLKRSSAAYEEAVKSAVSELQRVWRTVETPHQGRTHH